MPKIYITGIGAISAIGSNVNEHLTNLRNNKTGIKKAINLESDYKNKLLFGEVIYNNIELIELTNSQEFNNYTRTTLLALKAFQEAIHDANLSKDEISDYNTSFVSGSTVGGMCHTNELYHDANLIGKPSQYVDSYEAANHVLNIQLRYNLKGYNDVINTACSSSANAIYLGVKLIQSGRANRVIVGGTDSLAKYTVNGFNALMILSSGICRPFDRDRDGLTLGEGAAYLILESEKVSLNKKKYAEVSGIGNSNDAFHPSTTSNEAIGPILAINQAIKSARITPDDIDYINTHGTGTVNNDLTELKAIQHIFNKIPAFNSTKSYTGHTLGAAGALEAVVSILSLINNEVHTSLHFENPMEEFNTTPIMKNTSLQLKNVLSNSFGFGGNCTTLIFSKCS